MIKKIVLFILILNFVISCGKKGDPEFKETKNIKTYKKVIFNEI
tara:strand:+ start:353 stop:484 length:132 start_codon:yes stop_codon:yes gene_type:complete